MEDFAQVFGQFPNDKYRHRSCANIAGVLWAESGEEATWEFVRRLVFSVLIGNADMHLKNWSLLYPDRRKPVLSPAYDFVATPHYIPGDTPGLSFGGSKGLDGITPEQMRSFADTAWIPGKPALADCSRDCRANCSSVENTGTGGYSTERLKGSDRQADSRRRRYSKVTDVSAEAVLEAFARPGPMPAAGANSSRSRMTRSALGGNTAGVGVARRLECLSCWWPGAGRHLVLFSVESYRHVLNSPATKFH